MSAGVAALLAQTAGMSGRAIVQALAVVGDDTAICANQLIGGQPERKFPMLLRVVKGSLKNKAVIIPAAMALSVAVPWMILPSLAVGGVLLCLDSAEKLVHKKLEAPKAPVSEAYAKDHAAWENRHVKSAIKTDVVLSAETTAVALWAVAGAPFLVQLGAVVATGLAVTAGVYTAVGAIIKMDDMGRFLERKQGGDIFSRGIRALGRGIGHAAPPVIKIIGALGTAAMFAVGGTMLVHGIPGGEHLVSSALGFLGTNTLVTGAATLLANGLAGLAAGFAAVPVAKALAPPFKKLYAGLKKLVQKPPQAQATATPAPQPEPPAAALQNMPDVKASLNAAANNNAPEKKAERPELPCPPKAAPKI